MGDPGNLMRAMADYIMVGIYVRGKEHMASQKAKDQRGASVGLFITTHPH
jgi:hypothetical protein